MKRKLTLLLFLSVMWIASSAQQFVINSDSLSCFTYPELRTLGIIINERNEFRDLLNISETKEAYFIQELDAFKQIEADLTRVVALKDSIINIHQLHLTQLSKQNKKLKLNNKIIIGIGLSLGALILIK